MRTDLLTYLAASTVLALPLTAALGCMDKSDEVAGMESGDEIDGSGDGEGDGDGEDNSDAAGEGDGDGDCEPGDLSVTLNYDPFDFGSAVPWDVDLEWTCVVASADNDDGLYLELDCPMACSPVVIEISANPSFSPPVFGGETIKVRYIYERPWWSNLYLRLDLEGYGHLLTLIHADSLLPFQKTFELPFAIEDASGLCSPEPDSWGSAERLALEFDLFGETARIFDGSHALVGGEPGVKVWVVAARRRHETACTDTPHQFFRFLIVNEGWE